MLRRHTTLIAAAALVVGSLAHVNAEEIVFPRGTGMYSGIIDVVRDSGVDNSGHSDVTARLNAILGDVYNVARSKSQVLYFPKGTYLVSGTLWGPICSDRSGTTRGPVILGESRTGTVIRLADGTWPNDPLSATNPDSWGAIQSQVVLHAGDCFNTTFDKEIHNFTVDIGRNNGGAVGIVFTASNAGMISDVNIVSRDGQGSIGLAITGYEVGPAYARSIRVDGFKRGVFTMASVDITLSQFVLQNQTEWGLVNIYNCYIDSLSVTASAPAMWNTAGGRLVLINGFLTGRSVAARAIRSQGRFFGRSIASTGYQGAITSTSPVAAPSGNTIDEYASHGAMGTFFTPGHSMNLPVKYPPFPAWETDTTKWTDVQRFKGTGAIGSPNRADSTALRMAFTAPGKTTVVVPFGRPYTTNDTIFVRGDISRVVGTRGTLNAPAIVIGDGTAPVVMLQMLAYRGPIFIRTSRTVILESVGGTFYADGTGDLFINDQSSDPLIVRNPLQKVWVRKYNMEMPNTSRDTAMLQVRAGTAWILGYKSEGNYVKAECSGGSMEILGLFVYGSWAGAGDAWPADRPMVRISGTGQASIALITQVSHANEFADLLVSETRGNQTEGVRSGETPDWGNLTLYTGFDETQSIAIPEASGLSTGASARAYLLPGNKLAVTFPQQHRGSQSVSLIDMRGRMLRLAAHGTRVDANGTESIFDLGAVAKGAYVLNVGTSGAGYSRRLLLTSGRN